MPYKHQPWVFVLISCFIYGLRIDFFMTSLISLLEIAIFPKLFEIND